MPRTKEKAASAADVLYGDFEHNANRSNGTAGDPAPRADNSMRRIAETLYGGEEPKPAPRIRRTTAPAAGFEGRTLMTGYKMAGTDAAAPTQQPDLRVNDPNRSLSKGEARARWAEEQVADPEKAESWGPKIPYLGIQYNDIGPQRCNEFVSGAHKETNSLSPDSTDSEYPTPRVSDLANPDHAKDEMLYMGSPTFPKRKKDVVNTAEVLNAKRGDVLVWYNGKEHHSVIYAGGDKVIYAGSGQAKEFSLDQMTRDFGFYPAKRRSLE